MSTNQHNYNNSKGYSLHIALNKVDPGYYAGEEHPLYCCVKDAKEMQKLAHHEGVVSSELLINEQATIDNLHNSLKGYSEELEKGDFLFITYSGHGGRIPDKNGDEDDGYDETWCLYDGHFIDDELYHHFSQFTEGVRIFVVSDSCHSGTVTKEAIPVSYTHLTLPTKA